MDRTVICVRAHHHDDLGRRRMGDCDLGCPSIQKSIRTGFESDAESVGQALQAERFCQCSLVPRKPLDNETQYPWRSSNWGCNSDAHACLGCSGTRTALASGDLPSGRVRSLLKRSLPKAHVLGTEPPASSRKRPGGHQQVWFAGMLERFNEQAPLIKIKLPASEHTAQLTCVLAPRDSEVSSAVGPSRTIVPRFGWLRC